MLIPLPLCKRNAMKRFSSLQGVNFVKNLNGLTLQLNQIKKQRYEKLFKNAFVAAV